MTTATETKKRGRPANPNALTAAERKAKQRALALQNYRDAKEGKIKISEVSLTALYAELQKAVKMGFPKTVIEISKELEKRANSNNIGDSHKQKELLNIQ